MQVTYTTTLEDYVAFNRHVARKSTVLRVVILLGWFVIPAVAVAAAVALVWIENLWPVALVVAAFGLLYAIIYPLTYWLWFDVLIRAYAKGAGTRGVIGRITLVFTEETMVEITETTRSEVRWRDIKGVEVAGDYTFIFVTGLSAAILPRKGFDCDEDYDAVCEFALNRTGAREG